MQIVNLKFVLSKIFFIFLFFKLLFLSAYSQSNQLDWAFGNKFSASTSHVGTAVDNIGNVYHIGYTNSDSVDFDPSSVNLYLTNNGDRDIYLQKIDSLGQLVYAYMIGGNDYDEPFAITTDDQNNVFIAGYFRDSIDIDPGPQVSMLYADNNYGNRFILKLDQNGNFKWARRLSNLLDVKAIVANHLGEIIIGGEFFTTVDFDPGIGVTNRTNVNPYDTYVFKLDSLGDFVWVETSPLVETEFRVELAVDQNNNIYMTGGRDGFYVLKISHLGVLLWKHNFMGNHSSSTLAVGNSSIYLTGLFQDSLDFDPDSNSNYKLYSRHYFGNDFFMLKLDLQGSFEQVKHIADNRGIYFPNGIAIDSNQDVYLGGGVSGTVDIDPSNNVYQLQTSSFTNQDIFITKLDSNLNIYWAQTFGGSGNESINKIAVTQDLAIAASGMFTSNTIDFDPTSSTHNVNKTGASYTDFCFQLSQQLPVSTPSIKDIDKSYLLYPNPGKNVFYIDNFEKDIDRVEIYDSNGRLISQSKQNQKSVLSFKVNGSLGTYFVKVYSNRNIKMYNWLKLSD